MLNRKVSLYPFSIWCILFAAYCILFFSGCANIGTAILPPYIKNLHVNLFLNKSFRPDLPEKFLSTITQEFIVDGRLVVSGEKEADAILYGEIALYDLQPLSYTEQMKVQEYKVRIIINVWLKDVREDKVLWQESKIESFTTVSSITGGLEVRVENDAIDEVVQKLARRVVKRVIDGWT